MNTKTRNPVHVFVGATAVIFMLYMGASIAWDRIVTENKPHSETSQNIRADIGKHEAIMERVWADKKNK